MYPPEVDAQKPLKLYVQRADRNVIKKRIKAGTTICYRIKLNHDKTLAGTFQQSGEKIGVRLIIAPTPGM